MYFLTLLIKQGDAIMTEEQVLSMVAPKQKLANLKEHLPGEHEKVVYDFGKHLAEYLDEELAPIAFVICCMLALDDLQTGNEGFNGKPIESSLAGYPRMVYAMLEGKIPHIADAIFPAEFAAAVKAHLEEVNAEVQEPRKTK